MQFSEILMLFLTQLINLVSLATGLSFADAKLLLLIFLCYLIFVLLCTRIYVFFSRKQKNAKRTIVFEYNRLWYQLAQYQHTKNITDDNFFFFQQDFLSHNGSTLYFTSKVLLIEYFSFLEKKLGIPFFSQQYKVMFSKLYRIYGIYKVFANILLGFITLLTLGSIRLFVR